MSLLPKKGSRGTWKRYSEEVEKICLDYVFSFYLEKTRPTVADILEIINAHINNLNQTRTSIERLQYVTRCIFKRLLSENYTAYEIDLKRYGRDYTVHHYRGITNHQPKYDTAFAMGAMDYTRLDVIVTDDQGRLLGRPNFTTLINSATRCIMGFYLGFTPPSDLSVSKCFKHALLPKHNLKDLFPDIQNEWLAFGPLLAVKVDNALEFHRHTFEGVCSRSRTNIIYSPRKEPWTKREVERYLKTQNIFVHSLSGTTFSNIIEKGDYQSEKEARITLKKLIHLITRWIVDVYHQKPHQGLNNRSPQEMWTMMVDQNHIPLFTELGDIDYLLAKVTKRNVDQRGVSIEGIWYSSIDLINLRKECGEKFKAKVHYSEEDLTRIWVDHPSNENFYLEVPAVDQEYAYGLNMFAHKVNRKRTFKKGYPNSVVGYSLASLEINHAINEEKENVTQRGARFNEESTQKPQTKKPPSHRPTQYIEPETEWKIEEFNVTFAENRP